MLTKDPGLHQTQGRCLNKVPMIIGMVVTELQMGMCLSALTWGSAEALLGAGVHAVHPPVISKEGHPPQAADCVHQQQRVVLVAQLPQPRQALVHPRAALTLHSCMHSRTQSVTQPGFHPSTPPFYPFLTFSYPLNLCTQTL